LVHVSYSTKTRGGHGRDASQDEARQYTPATLIPVSTRAPRASAERSPPHHPHRQAARRLPGPPLPRHPGAHNAITDVPGIEVGSQTLIQADSIRTGVTAIHPRGKANPATRWLPGSTPRMATAK